MFFVGPCKATEFLIKIGSLQLFTILLYITIRFSGSVRFVCSLLIQEMRIKEQEPLLTEIKYLVTVATDSVSVAIASGQQFIMAIISDQIKQGITFPLSLLHE